MDLRQAQRQLTTDLTPLYGSREATLIADWVIEHLTGHKKIDRLTKPMEPLPDHLLRKYYIYRSELLAHRPVQYVLRESWFAGMRFYVDENVLIPRPETEELVQWVIETIGPALPSPHAVLPTPVPGPHAILPTPSPVPGPHAVLPTPGPVPSPAGTPPATPSTPSGPLLDVGTGSGCIAITLARKFPALPIHACDISTGALHVAGRNANTHNTAITFHHLDFLDPHAWTGFPSIQWLVSNPPYIPNAERPAMAPHVTGSEPAVALFVPDSDPLIFYRAIAGFSSRYLQPGGAAFVEIHEGMANPVAEVFRSHGASTVEIRKDLSGKDRMIKGNW
ncbi:MAG TPA: HemK/PrmC family methyltransferase [Puia sp.]|nr:HemK/PrmC family methyltransferase [Puia sp.]